MPRLTRTFRCVLSLIAVVAMAGVARAERPLLADELPAELEGVGIVERLGETLPLDLRFVDEQGRIVRLGDYFEPERPVLLTLNFYRCAQLCSLTLNGVLDVLNQTDWTAGEEFTVVTISIADEEGPDLAQLKKKAYLSRYDRPEKTDAGWSFLTGDRENIDALCKAVGFGYRRVEKPSPADDGGAMDYDYAHSSTIVFVTPEGVISRYMNDIQFPPDGFRLGLVEASRGAIGKPMEKLLLSICFRYDPDKNSYVVSAVKLMRLAGAMTVVLIGAGLLMLWIRGPRHGRQSGSRSGIAISGVES
jgi:protein SCO1/2